MTIRPVGAGASVIIAGTATTSSAFRVQSNALRVVAKGKGCHIAIGTDPVATATNFYVAAGEPETIALTKASQVVVGVTKGSTTVITAPEGTQMPFGIGDRVTMTGANDSNYDTVISNTQVTAVNTTAGFDGNFQTSITVEADTSGISTAFTANSGAAIFSSQRISVLQGKADAGGGGALYFQQVQRT
jgi:hypothetical protein|tara:strand:+ start:640 stop:1203 length:564 start_codon:yes stop_codon:yes gene_type:complete